MEVLIAGSTGLVGKELLQLLLQDPQVKTVYTLLRKPSGTPHPKVQEIVLDYTQLPTVLEGLDTVSAIFSCLGTTKAKTPDKAAYKAIEVLYPLQLAQWAEERGTAQFHYISALGASSKSSTHYLQLKGQAETALLASKLSNVYCYRPSLLLGHRTEQRTGERIGALLFKLLKPLLRGPFKKYRAISAITVAKAMLHQSRNTLAEHRIILSDEIELLEQA
ncbi:hypothetical protein DBR32_12355 [Taibaiella sp. KBW10]|uniref:NAD(P)H-binding protein n=1 Tax=Taibaiella sp. KBW10 TaxID=2153357 RepID=UPI000F59D3C5|nr:NAD(P)H-binding protein [Taibaiella sp. KBW10]RQO30356.1 hypothetical protein DBR32_12355 [Taibaiella sp. KBW10]